MLLFKKTLRRKEGDDGPGGKSQVSEFDNHKLLAITEVPLPATSLSRSSISSQSMSLGLQGSETTLPE